MSTQLFGLVCTFSALLGAGDGSWELETADTQVTLVVRGDRPVLTHLSVPGAKYNWAGKGLTVPLLEHVWLEGEQKQPVKWKFQKADFARHQGRLILTFTSDDPQLTLKSVWLGQPGAGPVRHRLEIANQTGKTVTVPHQDSLTLSGLNPAGHADLWWVRRGGSDASKQGGTFTTPVDDKTNLVLPSNCDDGASPVPWLALQVGSDRGLYVGWEFSGLGRLLARSGDDGQLDVRVGNRPDFKTDVRPGDTLQIPSAFVGCYHGDVDDGSYRLHRFILEMLRPSVPKGFTDPTLAYNLYLDVGGNKATEADVLRSARFCHELGFETFMPDAMWFPETGDWRWDPKRFPRGIGPIEEYVHKNGMKLAMWCAWTNGGVSVHPGALSVRGPVGRPDWFSKDFDPKWMPGPFFGGRLCLGCDEAKVWAVKKTQWLVSHHCLDYLKHDIGPIVTECNKQTHRHRHGVDASYWATLGYYEVHDKLLRKYPHLLLENCAGGGHIKDFGVLQRSHYTVTTDTLSNLPNRQSLYDSTYVFPPVVLQAYTYDDFYPVKGDKPGPFLWRSAMMGAWQIDPTHTQTWTEAEWQSARRSAEIYKQWIRPMLADAKVHHILPRPDGKRWDGLFYWNDSLKKGMFYVFRPESPDEKKTVRLKGLIVKNSYWVWSEDGSVDPSKQSGAALMGDGLPLTLPHPYTSDLIYVQDATLGKPEGLVVPGEFRLKDAEPASDAFSVSARVAWGPSANARHYRVVISRNADFKTVLAETTVTETSALLTGLPAESDLHWKVEAVGWGGKRWNSDTPGRFTSPRLKQLPGVAFVSDMKWQEATAGAKNTVRRDVNLKGNQIRVARKAYPKGFWTHAFPDDTPADVVVNVAGKNYTTFSAEVGVEDASGQGSVEFQVLIDGKLVARSPILRPGEVHSFRVDMRDAKEITLRVRNGGDGFLGDHAAWGLARFIEGNHKDPF